MSAGFVLDSAAAVAFVAPDEFPPPEIRKAVQTQPIIVPGLWAYETVNAVHMMLRRKRLDKSGLRQCLELLAAMRPELDPANPSAAQTVISDLALEHGLTVYDAAYLELAQRRRLPLATLDQELRLAAKKMRVPLI